MKMSPPVTQNWESIPKEKFGIIVIIAIILLLGHLNPCFCESNLHCKVLPGEHIWVVGLRER